MCRSSLEDSVPNPLISDQEDRSLPSPMSMQFKKLFESAKVGALTLKNRIVMPMINTKFGSDVGWNWSPLPIPFARAPAARPGL